MRYLFIVLTLCFIVSGCATTRSNTNTAAIPASLEQHNANFFQDVYVDGTTKYTLNCTRPEGQEKHTCYRQADGTTELEYIDVDIALHFKARKMRDEINTIASKLGTCISQIKGSVEGACYNQTALQQQLLKAEKEARTLMGTCTGQPMHAALRVVLQQIPHLVPAAVR